MSHRPVLKTIGRLLVGAMLFNALAPLSAIAQDRPVVSPQAQRQLQRYAQLNQRIEQAKADKARTPADKAAEHLKRAQDAAAALRADLSARTPSAAGAKDQRDLRADLRAIGPNTRVEVQRAQALTPERRADHAARLKEHLQGTREGQAAMRAELVATGAELQKKNLPSVIAERQQLALAQFDQRSQAFEQLSAAWLKDPSDANLSALAKFFDDHPAQKKAQPFDPKKLPWSTPKPTTRQPAETKTAWFQQLWGQQAIRTAQTTTVGPITFQIPPEPGQAPTEADLAQTPETQRTPAIVAQASALGNNPLAIHNWVRNTIEWVPTWGAVQSAEDTLNKKRGNAHDIASLQIALLRASGIPARYQYGTIEVTADQATNWVGGVNVVQAAQQLLGQGGIANRGIASAGRIGKVQLEHVWVSAYVNWAPARGARQGTPTQHVNPIGPHNAWTALDPSYKQYSYTAGYDLKNAVPLDANQLLNAAQQGATVNASEGWVQNLNQAAIQSQLTDYQARLKTYIDSQSATATVGDVIGRKIIPAIAPSLIAGSLPYTVTLQSQQVSTIPASLQHRFTYKLYASAADRADDNALIGYTEKTSQLVGKRLTLSYVPATQADADLIASYLPKPHADGSPIQPSEFPTSLPGYLIRLKPQITLDGQVVATSNQSLVMGTDLLSTGGFTQLADPSQWDLTGEESNVVGNATAIGVSASGISAKQLNDLKTRLEQTRTQLQANNTAGLSGEQISGDLLTATIWSWFAAADSHNRLSQNQANMVENPGLSYGLFHALAEPVYSWGVIRQVKFPGVNMDIGHVRLMSWSKANKPDEWVSYNRLRGQYMSALEHAVPERFFNDPAQCNVQGGTTNPALPSCPQGISAVKAIAIAASQGQRIYTITPQVYASNPGIVSNQLSAHSQSTKQLVQSYLDAGWEVSIHQSPIAQSAWTGAGFTVIDPTTGAGGYLIEGGVNGGALFGLLVGLVAGITAIVAGPVVAAIVGIIGFLISQYFAWFTDDNLNFSAARLIGIVAGIVLAVILGGYVVVSFSGLFVLGLALLLLTLVRLIAVEIYNTIIVGDIRDLSQRTST
jgi:transglutaminase-like putative cysteine protease